MRRRVSRWRSALAQTLSDSGSQPCADIFGENRNDGARIRTMTEDEWLDLYSTPLTEAQRLSVLEVIALSVRSEQRRNVVRLPSRVAPDLQPPLQEAA